MAVQTKRRGSFIIRGVLALFAIWMMFNLGSLIGKYNSSQKQYEALLKKRDELALEVEEKSKLLETGTDSDFIEKAAREKLGYVYPEEHIFIDNVG